jgi:hypothetical protein
MKPGNQLPLDRCPQCSISRPTLTRAWGPYETKDHAGGTPRTWSTYRCGSCGGVVLTSAPNNHGFDITNIWPAPQEVAEVIPEKSREYLTQAIASQHAPAGAVMLAASAIDAMLKEKGYKDGSLYARIDSAAENHLITTEMAAWAHEIRLDANDQRHADDGAPLPTLADAQKVIEFARALAQFIFVLPARVERGRRE